MAMVNRSSELAVAKECKATLCIFLDLAKFYDTVSHEELLDTLKNIG